MDWRIGQLSDLVWKVLWVWRGEADPHVGVDERHLVQKVGETQATLPGPVHGAEATAELRRTGATELLLRRVTVAVHVLSKQSNLPDTLVTKEQTDNDSVAVTQHLISLSRPILTFTDQHALF